MSLKFCSLAARRWTARHLGARGSWFLLLCLLAPAEIAQAQAKPAAKRSGELQAGIAFNLAHSDYTVASTLRGLGAYVAYDFGTHLGVTGEFHDASGSSGVYERSYLIGPRYVLHRERFDPYAKVMIGRGVFNFPPDPRHPSNGPAANLAYTIGAIGGGVDFKLQRSINLRADYEWQRWPNFPPRGLSPSVVTVGIAYRFH